VCYIWCFKEISSYNPQVKLKRVNFYNPLLFDAVLQSRLMLHNIECVLVPFSATVSNTMMHVFPPFEVFLVGAASQWFYNKEWLIFCIAFYMEPNSRIFFD